MRRRLGLLDGCPGLRLRRTHTLSFGYLNAYRSKANLTRKAFYGRQHSHFMRFAWRPGTRALVRRGKECLYDVDLSGAAAYSIGPTFPH
jgi:hypothetical protein